MIGLGDFSRGETWRSGHQSTEPSLGLGDIRGKRGLIGFLGIREFGEVVVVCGSWRDVGASGSQYRFSAPKDALSSLNPRFIACFFRYFKEMTHWNTLTQLPTFLQFARPLVIFHLHIRASQVQINLYSSFSEVLLFCSAVMVYKLVCTRRAARLAAS